MNLNFLTLSSTLLILPTLAAIPYSPSYLFTFHDDSLVYILRPSGTDQQTEFLSLNVSNDVSSTPQYTQLLDKTPFHSDDQTTTFLPVIDQHGVIKVFTGSCQNASNQTVWQFQSSSIGNGTWEKHTVTNPDNPKNSLHEPNFLAAGFAYASTNTSDSFIYSFGGMCPFNEPNDSNKTWISAANYSQSMAVLNPDRSSVYQITTTGQHAPPVAEAGLTITPLPATYSAPSSGIMKQQQNFLLIGGHTQQAFINMSELAIFSLPQNSWSFVTVQSEARSKTELAIRDTPTIEPRSGHTAVLTPDGSKVIVFGGWVGDPSVPAEPQLVVLEIGMEYGGSGPWTWKIPSTTGSGLGNGNGIYGHGAAMLPGGVMMITGGYSISQTAKRSIEPSRNAKVYFFNVNSNSWDSSYSNPNKQTTKPKQTAEPKETTEPKSESKSGGLSTASKAGIGAGIGVGIPVAASIMVCGWFYLRKRRARSRRDNELRKLALGAQRSHFWGRDDPNLASSIRGPSMRESNSSISWASSTRPTWRDSAETAVERNSLLIDAPSPTKSNRRGWNARTRYSYLSDLRRSDATGDIHPIDEREEYEAGSMSSRHKADLEDLERCETDERAEFLTPQSTNVDRAESRHAAIDANYLPGLRNQPSPENDRTGSNLSNSSHSTYKSGPVFGAPSSGRQSPEKPGSTSTHSRDTARSRPNSSIVSSEKRHSSDSYSTAQTTFSQRQAEGEHLLIESDITTPSDISPIKTTSKPRASEWIGGIRRVLSGTRKWAMAEREREPSPTSISSGVDHQNTPRPSSDTTTTPRRAVSASADLFQRKQGAKDWGADRPSSEVYQTARSTRDNFEFGLDGSVSTDDDEDWDVENAAKGRQVQVMFTVPKERLRVVNATTGELGSLSDLSVNRVRKRVVSR